MFKKAFYIMMVLLLAVVVSSCSKYQQLLKSTDNELKYEKAIEYFEQGDYYKSLMLLQQLNAVYRGTNKAEKLTYYMAYCYYEQKDYILASYYFKRYAQNFPRTDRAEECLYMNAYCYYLDSPRYSLDQSNTFTAIKELQLFINQYPDSERVDKANELMDDLRDKLEEKAFEIAELYYKMGDYQAAITSFKNILKDFPDAEYKEEVMLYILKAYYDYAINSIKEKKEERLADAVQAFETFVYNFPESEYLDEAGKYHKNTRQVLEKF
ncbi:MAG: outer membrane protein assembly factor BamD [Bacteroidales bacterium]|nr:outer membrane protein assembly factor BamD [Bacteroidales bacterium]MCF8351706.1 outer membrane protein assembly factor BamD [Bacteroidales bacterium]MCF8377016.1 outer membrane protein assembly factor BamD [Bacteroidales bacterium]MCF8400905.1 outer membrane protein assembly factor BamD [Bacteroidales bacterium]